jgi:hypothetical protein
LGHVLESEFRALLRFAGVVAFSSTGDPAMGGYDDEPTVISAKVS